jgi:uncharacterized protein (UPF0333 family)
MTGASVTWASFRSCDKCDLYWLSNVNIHQLIQSNSSIKEIFEREAQQEADLIAQVEANITVEGGGGEGGGGVSDNSRRTGVKGNFSIPNCVIHNTKTTINHRAANRILQSVELLDNDSDTVIATFKTVSVFGKTVSGHDNYIHKEETTKQMWKRWIINPHCEYKLYFDLVIAVMVLASSLTVPYRMGFGISSSIQWSVADGITEVFFCLDLILSFMTAFEYKDSTLDTSPKNIAFRYLRSWFLIDFLSAVPLYRITTGKNSIGIIVRLLKTLKLGRLFRLFKVFRFARILKLLQLSDHDFIPTEFIAIENSFGLIFKLLSLLGFTTHITACIFSWISIGRDGTTWATETSDIDNTFERYIAAQSWTYATMGTVGKLINVFIAHYIKLI